MDCPSASGCSTTDSLLSTGADLDDGLLGRQVEAYDMESESVADAYIAGTCTCEDSEDQDMFYMPMPSPKMLLSAAVPSRSRSVKATGSLSLIIVPDVECEAKEEACNQATFEQRGCASPSLKIDFASVVCGTEAEACNDGMAEALGPRSQPPSSGREVEVCKWGNIEANEQQALEFKVHSPASMRPAAMILDVCSPHTLPSRASKRHLVYLVLFLAFIVTAPAVYLHSSPFHNHHDVVRTAANPITDQTSIHTAMPSTCGCPSHGNSSMPDIKGTVAGEAIALQGAAVSTICAVQTLAHLHLCDANTVVPIFKDAGAAIISGIQDSNVPLSVLGLLCFAQVLAAVLGALGNALPGKLKTRKTVDKATSPRRDISSFPCIVSSLHTVSNMPALYCALLSATYSPSIAVSISAGRIPAKGPVGFVSLVPSSPTTTLSRATPHTVDSGARSSVSRAHRTKLPRGASEVHEDVVVKTLRSGRSYEAKVTVPVRK